MPSQKDVLKVELKRLIILSEEAKEKAKELRNVRTEIKKSKEIVAAFMSPRNLKQLECGTHAVTFKKRSYAAAISKDYLSNCMSTFVSKNKISAGNDVADKFVDFVWAKRTKDASEKGLVGVRRTKKFKKASEGSEPTVPVLDAGESDSAVPPSQPAAVAEAL